MINYALAKQQGPTLKAQLTKAKRVIDPAKRYTEETGEPISMEDVLGKPKEKKTMKNNVKVVPRPAGFGIGASNLSVGEYGRVIASDGTYTGDIVLRARGVVVNISNPEVTWDTSFSFTEPRVEKLTTGDKLEVTVGITAQFEARIVEMGQYNKISAIKEVREVTNWGLKEAKDYVEALVASANAKR